MGSSLNKRLSFTGDYYYYEVCCFKAEMSARERLLDSNTWCSLSFSLELLSPYWEYKTKTRRIYSIKSTLRELEKFDND